MIKKWTTRRFLRSVNNLHLWDENPRLDPSDVYITTKDYVEGMFRNDSGREDFLSLAKSIVEKGFLSLDPIVVWKNGKGHFIVAEGNRRVAAIKLLLEPQKAPKSIKRAFVTFSNQIDKTQFEKIPVCVAPSFEDCIWYINQRHEAKSTQKRWGRENYMVWISSLYKSFGRNIDRVKSFTGAAESDIHKIMCVLNLKEKLGEDLEGKLTTQEIEQMNSPQFPITTFERVINNAKTKEFFKLSFEDNIVIFKANYQTVLNAFAEFIHRLLLPKTDDNYLDSRTLNTSEAIEEMLNQLPLVEESDKVEMVIAGSDFTSERRDNGEDRSGSNNNQGSGGNEIEFNNPYRPHLIPKECLIISTDYRLNELFRELKRLSVKNYPNVTCASMRVFFDIAVRNYIRDNQWIEELKSQSRTRDFDKIELATRVTFLGTKFPNGRIKNIIIRLTNPNNEFSLDTLNRYIHSNETYAVNQVFVNRFWDFLYPLLAELTGISIDV